MQHFLLRPRTGQNVYGRGGYVARSIHTRMGVECNMGLGRVLLLREFRTFAAMAKTGNAEVPIEIDADINNLGSESGGNRAEAPSPTKKRERPLGGEQDRREGGGLTLADLPLALAPVLQGLQNLQGRMQTVEAQVSQKLDHTLNMVKTLHERQKEQENEIHKIAGSLKNH